MRVSFPNLLNHQRTSPQTARYNCIAWACGDDTRWFWPHEMAYWPEGIPEERTLAAFEQLFRRLGYEVCEEQGVETGYEKIAIFADSNGPTHAARQLPDGYWTSKLGREFDISHPLIEVEGPVYGKVVVLMRRPSRD